MPSTVLLSASAPDSNDGNGADSCDPADLREAVTAVAHEILGKGGHIVTGGHPSITPMLLETCQKLRRPEALSVYQSERFRPEMPRATWTLVRAGWGVLRFTPSFADRELDLEVMRLTMIAEETITGAVFIGGSDGVAQEHELVQSLTYGVPRIALKAPGGRAATLPATERIEVDSASRSYRTVARQISRTLGFR